MRSKCHQRCGHHKLLEPITGRQMVGKHKKSKDMIEPDHRAPGDKVKNAATMATRNGQVKKQNW